MRKLEHVYSYVGPASSSVAVNHHSNFISIHIAQCVLGLSVAVHAVCACMNAALRLPAIKLVDCRPEYHVCKFHMPQVLYLSPESGVSLFKVCFAIGGFLCGVWISGVSNEILRWRESELWFITYYNKTSLIRNQLVQTLR